MNISNVRKVIRTFVERLQPNVDDLGEMILVVNCPQRCGLDALLSVLRIGEFPLDRRFVRTLACHDYYSPNLQKQTPESRTKWLKLHNIRFDNRTKTACTKSLTSYS